ncbi:MAG: hypothetical protein J1F35_04025 [Erysipelotrichales bacterium]|nr:hypothetical protein [Erysipelotrichales bacterium]
MKKRHEVKYLVNKTMHLKDCQGYKKYQKCIFSTTDNVAKIVENIENPKKCLIPVSSGENSIELARRSIDVYSYDLNALSYFPQQLRIASMQKLEYDKFMNYLMGVGEDELLSYKIYCDIRSCLSEEARLYFDKLYDRFTPSQIFEMLFDVSYEYVTNYTENRVKLSKEFLPFYNEKEFYEAKDIDFQSKIRFCQCNILDLATSEYKDERNFDLAFFSNILLYLSEKEEEKFYSLMEEYYQEILSPSGALVNIFHNMAGPTARCSINFFYIIERDRQLQRLKDISDEVVDNGLSHNTLGDRANDIIHLVRK